MEALLLCSQSQPSPLCFTSPHAELVGRSCFPLQPFCTWDSIRLPAFRLSTNLNSDRGGQGTLDRPLSYSRASRVKKPRKIFASMGESLSVKGKGEFRVFESGDDLATSLADYVAQLSQSAIKDRGAFAVVLSGGSLINALRKLTEPPHINTVDWARWYVFWADERVVAKNHSDSNYKSANDNFLCKVPIVPGHVYSINDSLSVEAAADDYESGLRQLVKTGILDVSKSSGFPKFDLILLGMGPDGHIASLFPDHPRIHENEKWITFVTDSPKPPPERITFTLPVINSAANVAVVVTGSGKAETLKRVLGEELQHDLLPVQRVSPKDGKLIWFADKEAATKLISSEMLPTSSISSV